MKIEDLKFERKMLIHMALKSEYLLKSEITIICSNPFVNGRKFYSETITKKRGMTFGKSETVYYFNSDIVYKTVKELLDSI
jgi:hypothetical protein